MWAAITSFLARLFGAIFNQAMSEPGETHTVIDEKGTIDVTPTDTHDIVDRYSAI